ncbi:MAG: PTS sugar transporter subunit IIA, partial [Negativicutes bacterium]|nr:PTS sugar transporter subunit IIA [Negativicutes bacterium]
AGTSPSRGELTGYCETGEVAMHFNQEMIVWQLPATSKEQAVGVLSARADELGFLNDREQFIRSVMARERLISTSLGGGMAVPHGRSSAVNVGFIVAGRLVSPLLWDDDGEKAEVLFLIGAPTDGSEEHLAALAWLAQRLTDGETAGRLLQADNARCFWQILTAGDGVLAGG